MLKYEHLVWPATGPIYGFDMDDTLIDAHKKLIPGRAERLQALAADGVRIAIFTNQSRLKEETINRRFDTLRELGVPWRGFAATLPEYRKPGTKMCNQADRDPIKLEMFVGDAAGRRGDHSDCDLKFAEALDCKFQVPELFFTSDRDLKNTLPTTVGKLLNAEFKIAATKYAFGTELPTFRVILMVGAPASGKSSFAVALAAEHNYTVISNDTKTSGQFATLITAGRNVIIDNTHATVEQRAKFIHPDWDTAVVVMHTGIDECRARNELRAARVATIVYHVYKKKYESPTVAEGVWVFHTFV